MKWGVVLSFMLVLATFDNFGYAQNSNKPKDKSPDAITSNDNRPALYVAKMILVGPSKRDSYVACLQRRDLPIWQKMKRTGLLTDASVFEVTSVLDSEPGMPNWNFVFLTHLMPSSKPADFIESEKSPTGTQTCEEQAGAEVRRVEILRPTSKSNYPRSTSEDDRQAVESKVEYVIEYIAVHNTPVDLADYRQRMELSIGPAVGQVLIPARLKFSLTALETVSVLYAQPGMPSWNQLHINGNYPEGPLTTEALDAALRSVNPRCGGVAEVFGTLKSIRTKLRDDETRQLYELAVR